MISSRRAPDTGRHALTMPSGKRPVRGFGEALTNRYVVKYHAPYAVPTPPLESGTTRGKLPEAGSGNLLAQRITSLSYFARRPCLYPHLKEPAGGADCAQTIARDTRQRFVSMILGGEEAGLECFSPVRFQRLMGSSEAGHRLRHEHQPPADGHRIKRPCRNIQRLGNIEFHCIDAETRLGGFLTDNSMHFINRSMPMSLPATPTI